MPSGSFSRTALITLMDAESPLHNLFSCLVVALVCLTLTESLYYLPKTVLAAIIFLALRNMIDTGPFVQLWWAYDPENLILSHLNLKRSIIAKLQYVNESKVE